MRTSYALLVLELLTASCETSPLVVKAPAAHTAVAAGDDAIPAHVRRSLARVRQATAKYHNAEVALADGYLPFFPCESQPGSGGMGERWINFALLDLDVDELRPELLHYVRTGEGPKLVAVEYTLPLVIDGMPWFGPQPPPVLPPNPRMFDGAVEMLGPFFEDPTAPWHYNLFAWIWRGNPAGIFEPLNPKVKC